MMGLKPARDKAYWSSRKVFMLAYTKILHTELRLHSAIAVHETGIEQELIQSNIATKIKK